MTDRLSRAEYFQENPKARAWAELADATEMQAQFVAGPINLEGDKWAGKRALVLGAGIGGLASAYELLTHDVGLEVTVLEAQNRTGGRCLSLRTGDTLVEDENSDLFGAKPRKPQTVRFEWPVGDSEPYLNAGPGRIPSSHKRLLNYLREFGVAVEVYVMNSMSNLVYMEDGPLSGAPIPYRQIDHNLRGWLAQMVHDKADELLADASMGIPKAQQADLSAKLKGLMKTFGELNESGRYAPTAGQDGFENAIARAGFDELPGVAAGVIAKALKFDELLNSEFWKQTRFYQPVDFLWQPTLFQPVGGMDQVQRAFARKVAELGGTIQLNSPVTKISWDAAKAEFVVEVAKIGTNETEVHRCDFVFTNMAMPFLERILAPELLSETEGEGFATPFKNGLKAVFAAQNRDPFDSDGKYQGRFLAATTKVGWQADRILWQGRPITRRQDNDLNIATSAVSDEERGVVPIFGGISWTSHDIVQIWYPSNAYHDEKGVLTGAYNFGKNAFDWGHKEPEERVEIAREGAEQFGAKFGSGLRHGVAIAWQNMPYIKGGWSVWQAVGDEVEAPEHFNNLTQGSGVYKADGTISDPVFFIVGDQLSSLPGWQEGAIAAALNAVSRLARPDIGVPHLKTLPDTRLMVEGI